MTVFYLQTNSTTGTSSYSGTACGDWYPNYVGDFPPNTTYPWRYPNDSWDWYKILQPYIYPSTTTGTTITWDFNMTDNTHSTKTFQDRIEHYFAFAGIPKENISVNAQGNEFTVKVADTVLKNGETFNYEFTSVIPKNVDQSNVVCSYTNGQLVIVMTLDTPIVKQLTIN